MTTLDNTALETLALDAFVAWTQQRRADAAIAELTARVEASLKQHADASPYAARFEIKRNAPRVYVKRETQGIAVLERRHPAAYRSTLIYKRPTLRSETAFHGLLWGRYADEFVPTLPLFTLPEFLTDDAAIELRADLLRTRRTHKLIVDNAADVIAPVLAAMPGKTPTLDVGKATGFDVTIKRGNRGTDLDALRCDFPDVFASYVTETEATTTVRKEFSLKPRVTSAGVTDLDDDDDY